MHRKYTLTDVTNKKIEFRVYPSENNRSVWDANEIELSLQTRSAILSMISAVAQCMDGNSIDKLEVEEIT